MKTVVGLNCLDHESKGLVQHSSHDEYLFNILDRQRWLTLLQTVSEINKSTSFPSLNSLSNTVISKTLGKSESERDSKVVVTFKIEGVDFKILSAFPQLLPNFS